MCHGKHTTGIAVAGAQRIAVRSTHGMPTTLPLPTSLPLLGNALGACGGIKIGACEGEAEDAELGAMAGLALFASDGEDLPFARVSVCLLQQTDTPAPRWWWWRGADVVYQADRAL